jgi:hypothetical protein
VDKLRRQILRGPVKALIAVCLLAGVFAMHGLTGSHDAGMAATHEMPAVTTAQPMVTVPFMDVGQQVIVEAAHHGHRHAMGDVCLAMLVAFLLAIVAALALRSLLPAYPVALGGTPLRVAVEEPLPPWRRPTTGSDYYSERRLQRR